MNLNDLTPTRKIAVSGMIMALYIVVMYFTQSFAFGQYQIRIATAVYASAYLCPFLTLPLGLSNLLSNMTMGGLGIYDTLGGFCVGVLTAGCCALFRKLKLPAWLTAVPIAIIPAFGVAIWLSGIVGISYWAMVISLLVGQTIAGIFGALLITALAKAFKIKKGD